MTEDHIDQLRHEIDMAVAELERLRQLIHDWVHADHAIRERWSQDKADRKFAAIAAMYAEVRGS